MRANKEILHYPQTLPYDQPSPPRSRTALSAWLASDVGGVFNHAHAHVYQDMTRPLKDYFINSSHNT